MTKQQQHEYLMTLLKELEKEGNSTKLDNFIRVTEDLLELKYRVRNYFDYPISAAQYDELISYAEELLGIDPTSGRTEGATSAHSASNDLNTDKWIAFTAKQDIKKGDFVLIDEHDNQSVTPAADMKLSPTTVADLYKELEDLKAADPNYKVETVDVNELVVDNIMSNEYNKKLDEFYDLSNEVMEEYKEAYAALADTKVREKIGYEDEGWLDELVEIVVSIKGLESQDNLTDSQKDALKYWWDKLKSHLFGNI
jgi:hypothetical protein